MNLKNYISIILCVCIVNICFGQNNLIDSSFGVDGRVRPRFDRKPTDDDITIDKKNRIMLVRDTFLNGSDYATVFYRYNANGQPDLTFNGSGRLLLNIEIASNGNPYNYEQAGNLLFLNDHRITFDVAMQFSNSLWVRLNENGTFDTQFGTNGKLPLPSGYERYNTNVTTDNKFITSSINFGQLIISKYNTNGSPDNSFGTAGVRTINIGNIGAAMDYLNDLLIDANGNLFVIGEYDYSELVIVKLNPNGTIHSNYGTNGFLTYSHETAENESLYFSGSQLSADGKILTHAYDDASNTALVRFTSGGVPDNTFGTNGLLLLPYLDGDKVFENFSTSSGTAIWLSGIAKEQNYYRYLVSKRLNNGSVDISFGNNGYLTFNINNQDAYGYGIREITGGKLLMFGRAMQDEYYGPTMLQLLPNGQLDNSYASNGRLYITGVFPNNTNNETPTTALADLAAGPDNTILISGDYEDGYDGSFYVSSILENGTINSSFGNNGVAIISALYGQGRRGGEIVRQPDGKIVVAHQVYDLFTDANSILLQRLTATGQPDPSFGTIGRILIPFGPDDNVWFVDLKVAPNGKLGFLIEYSHDITDEYNTQFYQFTSNGFPDNSFSGDGKLIPAFYASHLVYNSQNKPILLGERYTGEGDLAVFENMVIQQFNENGTTDNGFNGGNTGIIKLSDNDSPTALILEDGDNLTILFEPELDDKDYAIAKLGSNGLPLSNWGISGIVAGNSSANTDLRYWDKGIRLDNGGYLFTDNYNYDLLLFKTTPAGTPDVSFANNGISKIDLDLEGGFNEVGIVVKPGGKLIVGGNEYNNSDNYDNKSEVLITQINLSAPSNTIYTLINPGNWSNPANWQTGQVPPSTITPGMEIIINPGGNGIATLDINVIVQNGGKITVVPGKRLNVNAMLTVPSIQ